MLIKQLSVYLENKTGRLNDVAHILKEENINMSAFSIAENTDFGLLRVIVSDPEKALAALKAKGFAVSLNNVICLHVSNKPGSLAMILDILAKKEIYIDYMYAFSEGDQANVVIRTNKIQDCEKVLQENKIYILAANELYK